MKEENKKKLSKYGIFLIILFSILTGFLYLVACAIKGRWLLPQDGFVSNTQVDETAEPENKAMDLDSASINSDEANAPKPTETVDDALELAETDAPESTEADTLELPKTDVSEPAETHALEAAEEVFVLSSDELDKMTSDAFLLATTTSSAEINKLMYRKNEIEANTQRLLGFFDTAVSNRRDVEKSTIVDQDASFSQKVHAHLDNRACGEKRNIKKGQPGAKGLKDADFRKIIEMIEQDQSAHSKPE
ncbi:MAG: hypothetical protein VXW87_04690 [Pseudomonadota bacterium]|nr:hypothetical protein [Pseudomonadota bacterium]